MEGSDARLPRPRHELDLIAECVRQGHTSGGGPYGKECERLIGDLVDARYVLLSASAGNAFEMAAMLANVSAGDEVILSPLSHPRVANAFLLQGARLVFADVRPDTLALEPSQVEGLVGKRTKVVVYQNGGGSRSDLDSVARAARRGGAFLVEDGCDFFGAARDGTALASSGDFGVYTFDESQDISCGDAGALTLEDRSLYERGEILREKGTNRSRFFRGEVDKYTWVDLGSSYVLSDLLAAFLSVQLERREELAERKHLLWRIYERGLEDLCQAGLISLPAGSSGCLPANRGFLVFTRDGATRSELGEGLSARGVDISFGPRSLHLSPMGNRLGYHSGMLPVAESSSARGLILPLDPELSEGDVGKVVAEVRRFFRR